MNFYSTVNKKVKKVIEKKNNEIDYINKEDENNKIILLEKEKEIMNNQNKI